LLESLVPPLARSRELEKNFEGAIVPPGVSG
jgi:hypothetical protein